MILPRIFLSLMISLMLFSCTPQFNEEFYLNDVESKKVIYLSALMNDENITQLVRLSDHLIIVNGVLIDTSMRTYGIPPKGGGYSQTYAERASLNEFTDWSNLVDIMADKSIPSKSKIDRLFKVMADSGFKEYHYDKDCDVHAFQSGSNVLKGFYGVLIGSEGSAKHISIRESYDYLNKIKDGIYYFEFR
ncbi:hypothetical protein PSI9734_01145 [Pseudidiomarina piscicola]|uniref:Uncharacterized protein n=1 Tax=Pseudidiomarina piscicola TaxID=2614830 RepID=A0A6S6WU97_9GAMM|nr:hypothetical protein [Pseudidiomarina piscicola]CAB0150702.1 hypothetical protein PSI9734_01145 [Pseudidiomarina piscicola]VZT40210.1 hypothetical protein PSI9734_01145 [Pseudomonas aeruginosa]